MLRGLIQSGFIGYMFYGLFKVVTGLARRSMPKVEQ